MKTKLRFLTPTHCIIAAFLSLVFAPAADAAWWREYQKMAMYISAETVETIESPQERAAAQLFKKEWRLSGKTTEGLKIGMYIGDNDNSISTASHIRRRRRR